MSKRRIARPLLAAVLVAGLSGAARADEYIIVNGLPCGTLCRAWMGIKLPPHDEPPSADKAAAPRVEAEPAKPRHAHHKTQKPKLARRKTTEPPAAPLIAERKDTSKASPVPASPTPAPSSSPAPAASAKPPDAVAPAAAQSPEPAGVALSAPAATPSPAATPEAAPASPPAAAAAPAAESAEQTRAAVQAATPTPAPALTPAAEAVDAAGRSADAKPVGEAQGSPGPAPDVAAAPTPPPVSVEPETASRSADGEAKPASEAKSAPTPAPAASATSTPVAQVDNGEQGPSRAPMASGAPEVAEVGDASASPASAAMKNGGSVDDRAKAAGAALARGAESPTLRQVLIVLAKSEVKTAGDLDGKTIIVAGVTSISGERLEDSLAAAGVSGAQIKQGEKSDIDQLLRGDAAAAVVAVATPGIPADVEETPGLHLLYFDVSPQAIR